MLFPAALLVVLGLTLLALDASAMFLGQRRLSDLAAAVATDAVSALDLDAFYLGGAISFDAVQARTRADVLLGGVTEDRTLHDVSCDLAFDGPVATASCRGEARPLLTPLWPGVPARVPLAATEHARATPG